ncbi:MAG: hypothetical protein P0S96_08330 [Simkaniaceae bacterium]|nr:hypothetical protein [Candidatus Sacchlamyda saccharinae]
MNIEALLPRDISLPKISHFVEDNSLPLLLGAASLTLVAIACLARSCKSSPSASAWYQAKLPAGPPKFNDDCDIKTHGHSIKVTSQSNRLRIKVSGNTTSMPNSLTELANSAINAWAAPYIKELTNSSTTPCRKQFTVSINLEKEARYVYEIYYRTAPTDLGSEQVGYELKTLNNASLFKFFATKGDNGAAGAAKPRGKLRDKTRSWANRALKGVTKG